MTAVPETATAVDVEDARAAAQDIRRTVLESAWRAGVGHIGSALSVADLVAAVYAVCDVSHPADADRDRIVLSKGHAALALFALLHRRGVLTDLDLAGYCLDGGALGVHPEHHVPGIDFATGSLGQGLPMAVGAALAARMQGSARRTFAVVSDAECNEGSIWEAAMFAGHQQLSALTVLVDLNGQQALGRTADISRVEDMAARWTSFGWQAFEVDGHDVEALIRALQAPVDRPRVVVARTISGYGVDFMADRVEWHYLPMTGEQFVAALASIGAAR